MSQQDGVQQGKDRYVGARLREHDEKLGELNGRVKQLEGSDPVEVPQALVEFVQEVRETGGSDEILIAAVFDRFGLGAFSDREIAAALNPTPLSEGEEPSDSEPGDEPGSDEVPGE